MRSIPEGEVALDEMESSMLIMDLIFKLKVRFPRQVFYLRGNHDSFSEEIAKGGIPQGLLWEQELISSRGDEYRDEMERFYNQLPYLVYSNNFVSCHAAAPTTSIELDNIINIMQQPKLINELINNRLQRPNRPAGYTKGDIKRLKKCLGRQSECSLHRRTHANVQRRYDLGKRRRYKKSSHTLFQRQSLGRRDGPDWR